MASGRLKARNWISVEGRKRRKRRTMSLRKGRAEAAVAMPSKSKAARMSEAMASALE